MATGNPFVTPDQPGGSQSQPSQGQPPQAPKDTSMAGMSPRQQLQAGWKGLGWDAGNANQYRGQQQQLVDYMNQRGGNWTGGLDFNKADDYMQNAAGDKFDIITSGGQFVQNPDGSPAGGGGASGSDPYNPQFNYAPWQADPHSGFLYDQLQKRIGQSIVPSAKDPVIAAQTNAFGAEQQRAARNYMKQQAEAGGPQNNMSMEGRMSSEHAAQATGQLQSQLMQNEVNARRQEIQAALSQWQGQLTSDQQMELQKELAYLSNDQFLNQMNLARNSEAYREYQGATS